MKKQLLSLVFLGAGLALNAQTPRLALYEEFTGETCPPCASTNPGLNALLALPANTANAVSIKWQVPIPSAPTNTWSLYQTNKAEIDWRYSQYGYGINSAPSGKMDGQNILAFVTGGTAASTASNHPAYLTSGIIASAASTVSPFSVTMTRAWDATFSSVNVTVNITASMNFTATGALVFRLVMVEKLIQFATQPGTNGETKFEDVAIQSFPTLQGGTPMVGTWAIGQTQSFVRNCPLPSYVRDKGEVAFVGFIQDDGNMKVEQAVRAGKDPIANDAKALAATVPSYFVCSNSVTPMMEIKNNGSTAITSLTVTPTLNSNAVAPTTWSGNLAVGATTTIPLTAITTTMNGGLNCSLNISAVSGIDGNLTNNIASTSFYLANSYQASPVAEPFTNAVFPPAKWGLDNANGGSSWVRSATVGGFNQTPKNSAKFDAYNNNVVGDADDLYLPPMDLTGASTPTLTFDVAYAQYNATTDDQLEVMVSEDCGVNWATVYSNAGADLSTTANGAFVTAAFSPTGGQWRTESVALDQFTSVSQLIVKFRATSDFGNNIYIDNVNLKQTSFVGIATQKNTLSGVEVYPNPTNSDANVKITVVKPTTATISVVNVLGQVVSTKEASLIEGSNNVQLNVSALATGVYNVVINTNNGTTVKKLSVNH